MESRITRPQGKPAGAAPAARKNPTRRKLAQQRGAGLIHAQPRAGVSTIRDNSAPAVSISLNSRTSSFVDLVTLPKGTALMDSREKYIKATGDLYTVAKLMDGFKDNERWSNNTMPEDVFHSLFCKMVYNYRYCDGLQLQLIDGVYRIAFYQPVYFDESYPSIPVYWIPALEKVSRNLFDLCFYLVRMVHGMGIQYWDNENESFMYDEVEHALSHLLTGRRATGEDDKEIEELLRCKIEYSKKGEATNFLNRLAGQGSKIKWLKEFDLFIEGRKGKDTPLMNSLVKWLEIGRQLVLANENINDYIQLPEGLRGDEEQYDELPATPDQLVMFLWKCDDWWHDTHVDYLQGIEQNQGAVPYFKKIVLKTKADFKLDKTSFPELMLEFFYEGKKLEKKHRKAFASAEALGKALYKPANLIDIL